MEPVTESLQRRSTEEAEPIASVHLTARVPTAVPSTELDDLVLRDVLAQALDLWTELHGRPPAETVLTVLWCGPDDYSPAEGAPHHEGHPLLGFEERDVDVVVTDDAGARDHPLVWCEVSSAADGR